MRGIRSIHERDFLLGRVRNWPDSTLQPSISGPPIILQSTHETALDVVDQTPRAGTVMTAQIEAVDFFAFDNSYARLPDRFTLRARRSRPRRWLSRTVVERPSRPGDESRRQL